MAVLNAVWYFAVTEILPMAVIAVISKEQK